MYTLTHTHTHACTHTHARMHSRMHAGKVEAIHVLLEEGAAKVDLRDGQGSTPLLVSVLCDNASCAVLLAKHGADLEVRTRLLLFVAPLLVAPWWGPSILASNVRAHQWIRGCLWFLH